MPRRNSQVPVRIHRVTSVNTEYKSQTRPNFELPVLTKAWCHFVPYPSQHRVGHQENNVQHINKTCEMVYLDSREV